MSKRERDDLDRENTGSRESREAAIRGRAIQAETGHVTRGTAKLPDRDRSEPDVNEGAPWRRGTR
jgi:hypothetical protein